MRTTLILLLVLVVLGSALAGRRRKNKNKGVPCKYSRKDPVIGDCDTTTNTMTVTRKLKKGDPASCNSTMTIVKPCKQKRAFCKYTKSLSNCDTQTNTQTMTKTLRKAVGNITCHDTMTFTRPCKFIGGCRYKDKYTYECNNATGIATGTLKLKGRSNTGSCAAEVTVQLPCVDAARMMDHIKAWKAKIAAKKAEKKQRKKQRKAKKRQRKACKYSMGPWSQCDQTTDTISRTLTLSRGDPNVCEQVKELRTKCRKSCKYKPGKWGKCDKLTYIKQRTDTLKENSESFCEKTRIITKKCAKNKVKNDKKSKKKTRKQRRKRNQKCVYDKGGEWSQCDPTTNKRMKTKTLKTGDPEKCQPQKIATKSCVRPNGEERCFFGKWKEWGECMNGVRTKQRIVQHGGVECQRRAVKTKAC